MFISTIPNLILVKKQIYNFIPSYNSLCKNNTSDYLFFPKLKKWLGGQRFANNVEVKSTDNGYFEELDSHHYKQGIETIENRWVKCIVLKRDYIRK